MIKKLIDIIFNNLNNNINGFIHYNLLSVNELLEEEFYSTYIIFVRIEDINDVFFNTFL